MNHIYSDIRNLLREDGTALERMYSQTAAGVEPTLVLTATGVYSGLLNVY